MEHALDTANTPTWIQIVVVLIGLFSVLSIAGFMGFRWKDGFWGAILLSFNLTFAGLITFNYYEGLGKMVAGMAPIGLYYWDSLVFILMLYLLFGIFTLITNRISRVIVTFPVPVENAGKGLLLLFIWSFQIVTLVIYLVEIGPTAPKPIAGIIDYDKEVYGKDIYLRDAIRFTSLGALSTFGEPTEFDPDNNFDLRHYKRRCALFDELWKTRKSQFTGTKPDFL
ncbi:MAG: hypothetical protein FWD31_03170 [Planctomycetaceae bacterium]|nr:hypothetical protein [Planctomycetaceae bacterium]